MFQQCQNISFSFFFAKMHHSNISKENILKYFKTKNRYYNQQVIQTEKKISRHDRSCSTFCMTKADKKAVRWIWSQSYHTYLLTATSVIIYSAFACSVTLKSLQCVRDKLIIIHYQSKGITECIDSLKVINSTYHIFLKFGAIHWQNLRRRQVSGAKSAPEVHSCQLLVHFNKTTLETLTSTEKLTSISQSRRMVLILGCSWGCLCR